MADKITQLEQELRRLKLQKELKALNKKVRTGKKRVKKKIKDHRNATERFIDQEIGGDY